MKILLINAPARNTIQEAIVVPPLGLAYLAAVARRAGHEVSILDAFAEALSWQAFADRLAGSRYDVIGLSGMTPVFDCVQRAMKICRPHAKHIVLGGPHVTAFRTTVLQDNPQADFAVFGEAERSFVDLLEAIQTGRTVSGIPGVVSPDTVADVRPFISDLDEIPFPARDLLPNNLYRYPLSANRRMTTIISSRGCPYQCAFCDKGTFGSKWRAHSAEQVLAEIDEVFHKYSVRYVVFYDDLFTLNKQRLRRICEGLIERQYPLTWKAEGRVDLVDAETLSLMRRAGCDTIAYGVETANTAGLQYLGKKTIPEDARRAFRLTHNAGIKTMGYFILGIPVETYKDALGTIEFAIQLKTDYAQFSVLSPFPGTRLYDQAKRNGWYREISAKNVSDKDLRRPAIISENWTEKQLVDIVHQAHRRFYLRFGYVLKRLSGITSLRDLSALTSLGMGMVKYVFRLTRSTEESA